jgi:hypothetical protein
MPVIDGAGDVLTLLFLGKRERAAMRLRDITIAPVGGLLIRLNPASGLTGVNAGLGPNQQ